MSGDLRAAVEGLPQTPEWADDTGTYVDTVDRAAVLALIPEGAVLVTEETLAATLTALDPDEGQDDWQLIHVSQGDDYAKSRREWAAAILRHLREGT